MKYLLTFRGENVKEKEKQEKNEGTDGAKTINLVGEKEKGTKPCSHK